MTLNEQISLRYQKQHDYYTRMVRPYFYKAIIAQNDNIINYISKNGVYQIPYPLLIDINLFKNAIIQSYNDVGVLAAKRQYYFTHQIEKKSALQFLIEKWNQYFQNYAINYANIMAGKMSQTTLKDFEQVLSEAINNKLFGDNLIKYIQYNLNGGISKVRAIMIARTETTTITNLANETASVDNLRENGHTLMYKGWIGRADNRERHTHLALNDVYQKVDTLWNVGGEMAQRPGDINLSASERVNCRCTQIIISESTYNRFLKRGLIKN